MRVLALALLLGCDPQADGGGKGTVHDTGAATGGGGGDGGSDDTGAATDADGDGVPADEDCDDSDPAVSPQADERCGDGVDNDCDGETDEDDAADAATWEADADGDGFGDPAAATTACTQPGGTVAAGGAADCDDSEATAFPGGTEVCDELDNDCDGTVDEDVQTVFYADLDGDGWGDAASTTGACVVPAGYAAAPGDCDDTDPAVHPGTAEVCDAADTDEDCSGAADDADSGVDPDSLADWYADTDGDGFGDPASTVAACDDPSTATEVWVGDASDCDDTDASIHVGATEVCDAADTDEDCDGLADDADPGVDTSTAGTWYYDADEDGYGEPGTSIAACDDPSTAAETWLADGTDCEDEDPAIHPGATEVCDEVDNDCDGDIDDDDSSVSGASTWYLDGDSDGYGDATDSVTACTAPTSYIADATDCDDADSSSHPGGTEVCDGADNDCSGTADDGAAVGGGAACAAVSCADVLDADATAVDGVYTLSIGGSAVDMVCDMTDDGGGWTLVANFVWPGSTAGVSGWTSGSAVGSDFSDETQSFKLADGAINSLVSEAYRAAGQATVCVDGACAVDIVLFWDGSCSYASGSASAGACAVAYRDVSLSTPSGYASPCGWHYGLTSVSCGSVSEMGTGHSGDHVFAGVEDGWSHAYSGRSGEDPDVQVWVR